MPFQPGNKLGSGRKEKPFRDALRQVLARENGDVRSGLEKLAETLVRAAHAGEMPAIKEIIERIDGKVAQPLAGDEDNPLTLIHRIESIIVDAANPDSESLPAPIESEPI